MTQSSCQQTAILDIFESFATTIDKGFIWGIQHPIYLATLGSRKLCALPQSMSMVIGHYLIKPLIHIDW